MSKTRRFTSEQTEIVKLKTNYLLSGDWWAFTVSLPLRHGLAAGLCVFGMVYGVLLALVLADKLQVEHGLFLLTSGSFGLGVAAYTFIARSVAYVEIIAQPERETVTTTPVIFEENEPEPTPDSPPIIGNRRPYIYFPVGDDTKPLTTEQRTFFSRYSVGQSVVREDLQNSPAYKNKGLNISVNYPAFMERLKEAGILDANNSLTTFGVEWAKGE